MGLLRETGPYDRGSADRYYRRWFMPHRINERGERVTELTEAEIAEYRRGYEEETERKEF